MFHLALVRAMGNATHSSQIVKFVMDQDHNHHDLIHPPAACIKYKIYETYETNLEFI